MKKTNFGLLRVSAAVPAISVANPTKNANEIISLIEKAHDGNAGLVVFPDLCITGSTCGDLFFQDHLYQQQLDALMQITHSTQGLTPAVVLGLYVTVRGKRFSCACLIRDGLIQGITIKKPSKAQARWFAYSEFFSETIVLMEEEFDLSPKDFFDGTISLGFNESCDLRINQSTDAHRVGLSAFHRSLVQAESAKGHCGYLHISPSTTESTGEGVFSGNVIMGECGTILTEGTAFGRESKLISTEIDCGHITHDRQISHHYRETTEDTFPVNIEPLFYLEGGLLSRSYSQTPFIPEDYAEHCKEIFDIQGNALAGRIAAAHAKKSVIGISGGLDSTLAVLVSVYAHQLLNKPVSDILAITMPGFGTTGKTYQNALDLMHHLGVEVREIPIKESVLLHFKDIGQDEQNHDVTYENAQARERTQILMDVANMYGGLVIGTGDLSEEVLGWCTYNGDHMAMYNVNSGVPKTLVRYIVRWIAESCGQDALSQTLLSIVNTPISPELLPPDPNGDIAQKTEESVGPYDLHDFFIYHTIRWATPPKKLVFLACTAFDGKYDEALIKKWLRVFYRRFFTQQFKRSCAPDGPQIGSIGLSPR
ncbi:MAG: NAD(+) synthase, partial [Anaerovoracaceae bacterium]